MKNHFLIILCLILMGYNLNAQKNDSAAEIKFETALQQIGDVVQIGLPLTALIISYKKKDKEGLKQLAYGFTVNLLSTHLLKKITKKKRPENSNAYNAFPSGHTSTAFHAATYLHKRYGWKYGAPCFALATLVGYSRIEGIDDRHDLVDVVGGALLGSLSALLFTSEYTEGINLDLSLSKASVGINYSLVF